MEALYGILGVVVGSFIPWFKEEWQQKRHREGHAKYLAVQIICVLDEYTEKCIEVVRDDGTIMGQASHRDENGLEYYHPVISLPQAPMYPKDVDWKSIDDDLMYRILTLPNSARKKDSYINFIGEEIASMPDYPEVFEARWEEYAELGLEAISISEELRKEYSLPQKKHSKWNPKWEPKQFLKDKLKEIEKSRTEHTKRMEDVMENIVKGNSNDKN